MKKFRSKVGALVIIVWIVAVVALFCSMFFSSSPWWSFLIGFVPVSTIFGFSVFFIYYIVDGEKLIIKVGPFNNGEVDIKKIEKITKCNSWVASAASSWDRIGIHISKVGISPYAIVSPKDRDGFIAALLEVNPDIEVDLESK